MFEPLSDEVTIYCEDCGRSTGQQPSTSRAFISWAAIAEWDHRHRYWRGA